MNSGVARLPYEKTKNWISPSQGASKLSISGASAARALESILAVMHGNNSPAVDMVMQDGKPKLKFSPEILRTKITRRDLTTVMKNLEGSPSR